ncbi:MAG: TAXI family TRAP transporter solute-binding subunit [Hyphomicrobiaceae bacterium]
MSADASLAASEILLIAVPVLALLGGLIWLLLQFVQPAPPNRITIATGGKSGAYYGFAKRYAEVLKRSGIHLEVRATAGSIENVRLLASPNSGVDVALLQGGITNSQATPDIVSLGRMFPEPLWVFYRSAKALDALHQLRGMRLAVGPDGSGTRHLALALLDSNGIDANSATLAPISGGQAAEALLKGEVDAVFLAMAPQSGIIQKLMREASVRLMGFAQADAYTRLHPYLKRITLPRGAFDLINDIPANDVTLVAPVAALAVRKSLHPALEGLLIDAAREVHSRGGLFNVINEYPKPIDPELEMAEDAERYYKAGPSFLKRYLPFWLATFIERMIVIAVPVAGLLIPIFKGIPLLYRWRIKRRINFWYGRLKALEARLAVSTTDIQIARLRNDLDLIEHAVAGIRVPLTFSQDYYDLRSAVDLVRQRLITRASLTIPNMT